MNKRDVIRFIEDQSEEIENLRTIIREDNKLRKSRSLADGEVLSDADLIKLKNWHSAHCEFQPSNTSHVFSVELSWTPMSIVKIGKCSCGEYCDISQVRDK